MSQCTCKKTNSLSSILGLGTALITPFRVDGAVDYVALERLLYKQIAGGVDYIVVLGTTGEAATLTTEEKNEVRRFVADYISHHPSSVTNKPIPLVLGLGGNCTAAVCEQVRTTDFTGYSAILSVCPYYNKPSQEGLFQHFTAIARVSPIPIILYNVPGRAGANMLPETVIRIHKACPEKIIGIKEASGNLEQIKKLLQLASELEDSTLHVISGDDGLAAEIMQAGGAGLISVLSNAFPKETSQLVHTADRAIQERFNPLIALLFKEGNPSGIKTVLSQMGLIENALRLPLVPNSESVQVEIANILPQYL